MAYRSQAQAQELRSVARRGFWTPSNISLWEGIRDFVIRHPTVAAAERFPGGQSNPALNLYVRIPKGVHEVQCRYLKAGDYQRSTEISFGVPLAQLPADKRDE